MFKKYGKDNQNKIEKTLITKTEFSKLLNCTLPNVTYNIRVGNIVTTEDDLIDIENDLNKKFMRAYKSKKTKNTILKSMKGSDDNEYANQIGELEYRKQEAQTTKIELEVRRSMNQLIDKQIIKGSFLLIAKNVRELLLPIGIRLAPSLGGIFNNTDPEKIAEARIEIEKEISRAIKSIIEITEREITNSEDEEELEEEYDYS
jgi:hypothetical protein